MRIGCSERHVGALAAALGVVVLLAVVVALAPALGASPAAADEPLPNIVLIVTDDQRFDSMWALPNVNEELAGRGTNFTQAHVVLPLCCPARASILTGQYAHTTGIYGNGETDARGGGFAGFDDTTTIATVLDAAGYRTGLVGKYLNGYTAGYVPPGWDRWVGLSNSGGNYYDYDLTEDGAVVHYGSAPEEYLTDVLARKGLDFLDADASRPFFLMWTPFAPHADATPAPEHEHAFDELPPWRPPSYAEADVSDKPPWLRARKQLGAPALAYIDAFRERQLESLLSVDDAVDDIVERLRSNGELDNTLIVFTSDNGFLYGEHRLRAKDVPYEEATRVPMVYSYEPWEGAPTSNHLATNIDIAPTIAALAGTAIPGAEGRDLGPYLAGAANFPRGAHLIEGAAIRDVPSWCQFRSPLRAYTRYADGFEEYYNLARDPYQLRNIAQKIDLSVERARLRGLCDPLPPGMTPW
jgi:N-acetylglucosamine-6-sulfatase